MSDNSHSNVDLFSQPQIFQYEGEAQCFLCVSLLSKECDSIAAGETVNDGIMPCK